MSTFPECYGAMFPDFAGLQGKGRLEGRAFTARFPGHGLGPQSRTLEMNREACENCTECPKYRTCYDFSLARLLLNGLLMRAAPINPWVGA